MKVGYARVSTEEQRPDLQYDALKLAGCEEIFIDHASGAHTSRPALDQALLKLKPGDTLVTWKLDRLGRSLSHLIDIVTSLERQSVTFQSLSEAIDTNTATGRLLFHVMGALAEFERALISERTRAGIAAARARGAVVGRPPKLSDSQIDALYNELGRQNQTIDQMAIVLCVSPSTLKRALAKRR